ncbi:MAG TPA: hypothetical protein VFH03_16300 [Actinoplanes sp.]|nr:hypothetical protein [Actinoplanes sp.]
MTALREANTRRRNRGFAALLLVTAGVLILAGRVVPAADGAVPVVLGVEMVVWAVLTRSTDLLTVGGVVTGIGSGVLLAAGPLQGADPDRIGAAFLLSVAVGLGLIALLSWWPLSRPQHWAWIAAVGSATIGVGLLGGADTVATVVGWALPLLLIAAGLIAALRSARSR